MQISDCGRVKPLAVTKSRDKKPDCGQKNAIFGETYNEPLMKKMLWLLGLLLCVWQVPATVFGPAQAIRCPGCKQITLKEYSLLSGNTYDAVLWSDFKLVAPSMPQPPFLVKCPACGTLLLPHRHYCEAPDDDDWIMQAVFTSQCLPSFEECVAAAGMIGDPRSACWLALHTYNDLYREQRDQEAENTSARTAFIALAARFEALLDENDPDDYLLRAELCRETGDFDRCIPLLETRKPTDDDRDGYAARILDAARQGSARVFVLE